MQSELKFFSTHLGGHDFGVENNPKAKEHTGHLLSETSEGVQGLELPFISFCAVDKASADQFIKTVNWFAVQYCVEGYDIARLVNSADKLTGN
jgi:hypothetical protein